MLPATGRSVSFVAIDDLAGWRREPPGAAVAYVETLSNPMLRVANLPAIADLAHEAGATAIIDSTFASPVNVRPLEHGFDLVVHSATKYLNGHADLVAGVVAGSRPRIAAVRALAKTFGGCLDPAAAAKLDRSLKTLVLRMERHNDNALAIARWLQSHDEIEAVAYPLLDSHPDVGLATQLLRGGSGIVTLRARGGDERAGSIMNSLQLISQATSLGGVESLISAPYNTSHRQLDAARLRRDRDPAGDAAAVGRDRGSWGPDGWPLPGARGDGGARRTGRSLSASSLVHVPWTITHARPASRHTARPRPPSAARRPRPWPPLRRPRAEDLTPGPGEVGQPTREA